jgi:hypothetical protein
MVSPAALADRTAFLEDALGLGDPATRPADS